MDKKINVKITADASGFDRAIKKAQKEIENFAKQGEKLGKSKFGKNTSKQFDSITKSTKKASKQFEGIEKNLESISKTKLTKLNKEFTKTEKSGKKLDKQLASSEKNLKSLVKTKFTNLTKQFSNMEKSSKKLDKQFESNEKTLKSISKIKLNNVTKQFDKIEKAADDVSDAVEDTADAFRKLERADLGGIDDSFKDITKQVDKVQDSVKDLSDTFKKLDGSVEDIDIESFNNMNRDIDKLENNISSLSNSFRDLKNDISDIDKESLTNLTGDIDKIETNIGKLSDKFSELKRDVNKIDDMSLSGLTGDLSTISGKVDSVSNDFNDLNNEIDDINKQSFGNLKNETSSLGESAGTLVDSFSNMGESLGDIAAGKLGDLSGKLSIANSGFVRLGTSMAGTSSQMLLTGTAVTSITKAINGLKTDRLKMLETNASNLRSAISMLEAEQSRLGAQTHQTASDILFQKEKMAELNGQIDETKTKYNNVRDEMEIFETAQATECDAYKKLSQEAKQYKDELDNLQEQYDSMQERLDELDSQQVANYNTMNKFGEASRQLKAELNMVNSEIEAYGNSTKKASTSQKQLADSANKSAKATKESANAKKEDAKASKDAADANKDFAKSQDDAADSSEKMKTVLSGLKDVFDNLKNHKFKDAFKSFKGIGDDLFKNLGKGISDAGSKLSAFGAKLSETGGKTGKLGTLLSKAREAISSFGSKIASSGKNIAQFGAKLTDAGGKSAVLGSKIAAAGINIGQFGSKLAEAGGKASKLGSLLSSAGGKLSSFGASIASSSSSLTSLVGVIGGVCTALYSLYNIGKKQFFEGLINIKNKLQPVINAIKSFAQEVKSAFESITGAQLDLSSLMAVGPEFEYQMQRVGSIAGSNEKQLQKLIDKAAELGGTTQFTASQVGEAFEYMAMAGWNTNEMIAGIEDTINLAIISGSDLGTVSDIVTDGLTALGMGASSAGDFVDKMAATITSANTTVEMFGETMKQVGALAGSLGISMTDLSTATGLMANAGVKGSSAGTALKNVLSNMTSPTDKQAAALRKLGLTADETGSYLKTNAQGNVDLAATMKSLMVATKDMNNTQKAAILTQIAGKEAIAGLMSIMNQGEDAWNELADTIENSTGKVQYWNECMGLAGKSGQAATDLIENMKEVFSETETEATALGLSTTDLANAIAILGDDGKVTAENVRDLLSVIESMNSATGEVEEQWRALDKTGKSAVNTGYDYDATVAAITADTQGLTQEQKKHLITMLDGVETYDEAKKIVSDYEREINNANKTNIDLDDTLKRNTFTSMSYGEKLEYLRDNLKGMSEEERKAWLETMGLGDALDEVNEICDMSDKEFDAYTKNLETVKSMTEQLKGALDEVTKGSLLSLASAIENVAIAAFNKLKPAIQGISDALVEFFNTWHNGDKNEFTFKGFEKALVGLEKKVRSAKPKIEKAITDLINGFNRFVTGGSLDSILKIGTDIVTSICNGITKNKDKIQTTMSDLIGKVSRWITENGDDIIEAGKTLLDCLVQGIEDNQSDVNKAIDVICDAIGAYIDGNNKLDSVMSKFGKNMAELAVKKIKSSIKKVAKDIWNALFSFGDLDDPNSGGLFATTNPIDLLFGDWHPIKDLGKWLDKTLSNFNLYNEIKKRILKNKTTSKAQDSGNSPIKIEDILGKLPTIDECKKWIQDKFSNFHPIQWAKDYLFGTAYAAEVGGGKGGGKNKVKPEQLFDLPSVGDCMKWIQDKVSNWHPIQWIKDKLFKGNTTSKGQDSGNSPIKPEQLIKLPSVGDIKSWIESKISNWHPIQWIKDKLFKGKTTSKSQDSGNSAIKPEQLIKLPSMGEFKSWVQSKISGWHPIQWIKEKLFGKGGTTSKAQDSGNSAIKPEQLIKLPSIGDIKSFIDSKLGDFHPMKWIAEKWNKKVDVPTTAFDWISDLIPDDLGTKLSDKLTSVLGENWFTDTVSKIFGGGKDKGDSKADVSDLLKIDTEKLENVKKTLEELGTVATNQAQIIQTAFSTIQEGATTSLTGMVDSARTSFVGLYNIVNNQFMNMNEVIRTSMVNCTNIVRNQAVNMANIFRNQFINMANIARNQFVNVANIVRNQMVNSCNIVRNQCVNMANIFRNQFVSMANVARNQMVNVSNIVRNQAVAWSNIIRNQCQNARNALTSSMLSMAAVARTQMVNITNIVRNQAVAWANIVRSQSANMRGAMSSAFSGLAAVAARGMAACLATVRSYMARIRAATAQTMTMNFRVNKTVTTTNVTKNVTQGAGPKSLYNASSAIYSAGAMASTPSVYGNTQALARSASTVASSGSTGSNVSQKDHVTIEIPVNLDGKQIAKVSAKYMDGELSKINNRSNRKRGIA